MCWKLARLRCALYSCQSPSATALRIGRMLYNTSTTPCACTSTTEVHQSHQWRLPLPPVGPPADSACHLCVCVHQSAALRLWDSLHPVFTAPCMLPPSKIQDAVILSSLVSQGCCIQGSTIKHSILGDNTRVRPGSLIEVCAGPASPVSAAAGAFSTLYLGLCGVDTMGRCCLQSAICCHASGRQGRSHSDDRPHKPMRSVPHLYADMIWSYTSCKVHRECPMVAAHAENNSYQAAQFCSECHSLGWYIRPGCMTDWQSD